MSTTYRYSEARGKWTLSIMSGRPAPYEATGGALGTQPEWLAAIAVMARIGEHEVVPVDPPPDRFFWFRLTLDGALSEFVDVSVITPGV